MLFPAKGVTARDRAGVGPAHASVLHPANRDKLARRARDGSVASGLRIMNLASCKGFNATGDMDV